jgi:hypothetical protein
MLSSCHGRRTTKKVGSADRAGHRPGARGDRAGKPDTHSAKLDVIMLAAPRPERIVMRFRPDLLRRDVATLAEALELA